MEACLSVKASMLCCASNYASPFVCRWRDCVEGVAYTFGHDGGLIVYSFPDYELPDARRDELAVGLVTSQRSAVILRVVSGSSSDFIQLELVRILYTIFSSRLHCWSDNHVNEAGWWVTRNSTISDIWCDAISTQLRLATGIDLVGLMHSDNVPRCY